MNDSLTADEYDALNQISQGGKRERQTACVARNSKRLNGLKYITHEKDGRLTVTEKGRQILFLKKCIDGLRSVSNDPCIALSAEVATFLGKKGHIIPREQEGGFSITQRGRESLADIESTKK